MGRGQGWNRVWYGRVRDRRKGRGGSDFIWDFGKLPFPEHLGKYFIKIGKNKC